MITLDDGTWLDAERDHESGMVKLRTKCGTVGTIFLLPDNLALSLASELTQSTKEKDRGQENTK